MRFLSAVLFVALTGSVALADEAKPADPKPEVTRTKVPLRVVRMLPETKQVLLFDKTKGTHVVAAAGEEVEGYIVDGIDDDEVTLVSEAGSEVILTAPDQTWRRRAAERRANARKSETAAPAAAASEPAPEDPYAEAPAVVSAAHPPSSPIVAGQDGVRVASAADASADDPYADLDPGIAAFVEAVGATPTAPATVSASAGASASPAPSPAVPTTPAAPAPSSAVNDAAALGAALGGAPAAPVTASPSPAAAAPAGPTTATIRRAEIDAALANFAATASTFHATFTGQGLRFDDIASSSLLAKVGLMKGDVVTTVDGQPLRSLDDAANLYARLPTARGSTLVAMRSGKPVTLRISIQ